VQQKTMNIIYPIFLCLSVAFTGCHSGPPKLSAGMPPGYYLIVGHVKNPGLVKCDGAEIPLTTLIAEAGGVTHKGFTGAIRVVYAGNTNFVNLKKQDPLLPCGTRVSVDRMFYFW
jgi:hypothetical protein